MKNYILQTESGYYLAKEEVTRTVSDIKRATKFSYNDANSFSNLHRQISDTPTRLIEVNSYEFCYLVANSFSQLSEQVYKKDYEIDYESSY